MHYILGIKQLFLPPKRYKIHLRFKTYINLISLIWFNIAKMPYMVLKLSLSNFLH